MQFLYFCIYFYYSCDENKCCILCRTTKNAIRKFAGVPFAAVYGLLLWWIIDSTILTDVHTTSGRQLERGGRITLSTCPFMRTRGNASYLNKSQSVNGTSASTNNENSTEHGDDLFGNDETVDENSYIRGKLLYFVSGFMTLVGFVSVFSRSTRCVMLLILPGLITRHARTLLFTIIMGHLFAHPLHTIQLNMDEIFNNAHCLYQSVVAVVCVNLLQIRALFRFFGEVRTFLGDF